jgi:hypothetical protein
MKRFILFSLIVICFQHAFAQTSVDKEIGDEVITFSVPADYDTLKKQYMFLIDMYAEAENKNIELAGHINSISDQTGVVAESITTLQQDYLELMVNYQAFLAAQKRPSFFFGMTGGYEAFISDNGLNNAITLGPAIAIGNKRSHWQLALPLTITLPELKFGIGLFATILFAGK